MLIQLPTFDQISQFFQDLSIGGWVGSIIMALSVLASFYFLVRIFMGNDSSKDAQTMRGVVIAMMGDGIALIFQILAAIIFGLIALVSYLLTF